MKKRTQFLLFFSVALLGAQPVCRPMDLPKEPIATPTVSDLPFDIIRKIISHVPSGSSIKDRFKSVSTATECSKSIHTATTNRAFDQAKKLSETHVRKLSKLYVATCEASDNEKETMLCQAVDNKNYTTVSLLLEWYPHLINSCENNLLAYLLANTSEALPLDLVIQLVETDKKVNKTATSTLINTRSDIFLSLDRGYYVSFIGRSRNDGLSAMDILLYHLAAPSHVNDDNSVEKVKKVLQQIVQYLISQGGFFNTETYCSEHLENGMTIKYKAGANPTLGIIISMAIRSGTFDILELFLNRSHLNINTHAITGGQNALHWTASSLRWWSESILELLLKIPEIDVNTLSTNGETALDILHLAMNNGNDNADIARTNIALLQDKGATTAQQLKLHARKNVIQQVLPPDNPPVIVAQQQNLLPGAPAPAPVPGNNPPVIQHHWYKKSSNYWFAGIVASSTLVYGVYRYFYPAMDTKEIDEDEQETTQDDPCHTNDLKVT